MKNKKVKAVDTDMWVCNWCGSEEIYESAFIPMNGKVIDWNNIKWPKNSEYIADCCGEFDYPLLHEEWYEEVFDDCQGNKYEIEKIMDGGRK